MPEIQPHNTALSAVRPLNQEERQLARSATQEAVLRDIGERPNREHFNQHSAHRYPPTVTRLITALCILLLLAAFTPSAIRLYVIGSTTFGAAFPFEVAMVAVGIATVLTAEIGQVVFSLALATLVHVHATVCESPQSVVGAQHAAPRITISLVMMH